MTTPFWCLFIVVLLPYILAGAAGYLKVRQLGNLDTKNPRAQAAQLEGAGARAWAAQSNSWEAIGVFTAAVIVNHLKGADPEFSALLAQVFVASRVVHGAVYIADLDKLRSAVFLVGLVCSIWLFLAS